MTKRILVTLLVVTLFFLTPVASSAQCSICTKNTQQLGEKPATGMNRGILYLAFMPLAIIGVIGYRWWKSNKALENA